MFYIVCAIHQAGKPVRAAYTKDWNAAKSAAERNHADKIIAKEHLPTINIQQLDSTGDLYPLLRTNPTYHGRTVDWLTRQASTNSPEGESL